jgi:hypothetical protein
MKAIRVHDQTRGALDFDLQDILATLGARAAKSSWIVTAVEGEDDFGFDATGPASTELSALAEAGTRINGRHLIRLAENIRQTIWGRFVGYDDSSADPWIIAIAFDSTWFEIHSTNEKALRNLRKAFRDVRSVA